MGGHDHGANLGEERTLSRGKAALADRYTLERDRGAMVTMGLARVAE
jgi:hypothetical protein